MDSLVAQTFSHEHFKEKRPILPYLLPRRLSNETVQRVTAAPASQMAGAGPCMGKWEINPTTGEIQCTMVR